jgi:hypothetical protein
VHKVIERPPAGEAPTSAMGQERYYNKSEIILLVTNGIVSMSIKSPYATSSNAVPTNHVLTFLSTNKTMYDQREDRTQLLTEIDIAKLKQWMSTNSVVASTLGTTPSLIYVEDSRGGVVTSYSTNYSTNYNTQNNYVPVTAPLVSVTTNNGNWTPSSSGTSGVKLSDIPSNSYTNQLTTGTAGQSNARYRYRTRTYTYGTRITNVVSTTVDHGNGAVRLINGKELPVNGLTVSTPNGLYVKGHYNCPTDSHLGTTNTSNTKPASIVADAVTILSSEWNDSESTASYSDREPVDTTINSAIISGNVPAGGTNGDDPASGGAHNLVRYLEAWSGQTSTINGSLVCLYQSTKANAPFVTTGLDDSYYSAPTRNWSFDRNFLDPNKLPPGTPAVRVLERLKWTNPPAGVTTYAGY